MSEESARGGMGSEEKLVCLEVTVEDRSFVKPAPGSNHGERLYLSSLDLCWREARYTRRLLFYDTHSQDTVLRLRSSLAQVLRAFYPAAGRLISGPFCTRPFILCDGQGVEFLLARVNAPLSRVRSSRFQPSPAFHLLAPPSYHAVPPGALVPLLVVQMTKFVCGGLALGISCSKVLADGHSLWHLMNSWAECARNAPISIPPFLNREVFKVDFPSKKVATQFSFPNCKMSIHEEVAPSLVPKLLQFSSKVIDELKQEAHASKNAPSETIFSNYDVLCAHLWRRITTSRACSKLENELTIIGVLGDMRFRMKPQLPRGYFGNATIFAFASSLVKDMKIEPFGVIAQKIHEACQACNESRLWEIVNWLELHDNMFDNKCMPWMVTCLNVVSSPKFKVYDVDFGYGRPIAVSTSSIHNCRDMFLFPSCSDGIDVCLSISNL